MKIRNLHDVMKLSAYVALALCLISLVGANWLAESLFYLYPIWLVLTIEPQAKLGA